MVRFLPCQRIEAGYLMRVDQFGLTYQVPNLGIVWMPRILADSVAKQHGRDETVEIYVLLVSDLASDGSRIWIVDSVFSEG